MGTRSAARAAGGSCAAGERARGHPRAIRIGDRTPGGTMTLMGLLEWFFWACIAVVVYTYVLYPLLLVLFNVVLRKDRHVGPVQTSVSILLPVHNEEQNLARRLDELTRLIASTGMPGEVIVISDASTDRSADIAREFSERNVRVIEMPEKQGKAAALTAAAPLAQFDLLVFADARQRWADDALVLLTENFADPRVGAV